jgi:hypothetical protein
VIERAGQGGGITGLIVMLRDCLTLCGVGEQLSVAAMVNDEVPGVVGIPEIRPDGLRFSPDGKEPETRLKVIAPCPPEVVI